MAQAGEADHARAGDELPATPAAVFTFYAPHPHSVDASASEVLERLQHFPVTHAVIDFPRLVGSGNVQVEAEVALYADIVYSPDGSSVERLVPRRVAAFNDCSLRKLDGSQKLSEKKNWGFGSKGISLRSFRVTSFSRGTLVDRLVLQSYVKRDSVVHEYSVAAPTRNYLMFYEPLLEWIVDRINNQGDSGKWEEIFASLQDCDYPTSMWIALGAGEYTQWGESNFIQPKDETLVLLYDEAAFPGGPGPEMIERLFNDDEPPDGVVSLHQTFV